jgi:hypothetical protein
LGEFSEEGLRRSQELKPIAAIGDPPARGKHGERSRDDPEEGEGQDKIDDQPKHRETRPEDLVLHLFILDPALFCARQFKFAFP